MAEARALLPKLTVSKSSLQYYKPRNGPPIFYKERFQLPKETWNKTLGESWMLQNDPLMPAYPYLGDKHRFPEANHGLYGGATIQSGNKISKGRNKGKTLRKWFPNVKVETLRSQALKKTLTIPVTARVKRTINKCGGLDQYLLGNKPARIKELGLLGWKLRWHVMQEISKKKRQFNETFEEAWADPTRRLKFVKEQTDIWDSLRSKDEKFISHFEKRLVADKAHKTVVPEISTLKLYSPELLFPPEEAGDEYLSPAATETEVRDVTDDVHEEVESRTGVPTQSHDDGDSKTATEAKIAQTATDLEDLEIGKKGVK